MIAKLHVKKNDIVKILSGENKDRRDKKSIGKVLKVFPEKSTAIVEGVNLQTRHTKPNATYPQGGRITKEAPVHISKLMVVCPKCGASTRIGHKMVKEENTGKLKSHRACKKCGEVID